MRIKILVLLGIIIFFCVNSAAMAANYFVRAGASGSNDGSDWVNAYTHLPSTYVRGSTYWVATGNYTGSQKNFATSESGSTYIYIKKATANDSECTDATGWEASYGTGQAKFYDTEFEFTTDYWVLDGQVGSGRGDTDYGFYITQKSIGGSNTARDMIQIRGADYITVQYIEIEGNDIYVGNSGLGFYVSHLGYTDFCYYLTHRYIWIHNISQAFKWYGVQDSLIEYCYIDNIGGKNGTFMLRESGGHLCSDNVIRYTDWYNMPYIDDGRPSPTGVICIDGPRWEVYGNVISLFHSQNGVITTWGGYAVTYTDVYNNNIIDGTLRPGYGNKGINLNPGTDTTGNAHHNNLYYNCERVSIDGFPDGNSHNLYGEVQLHGGYPGSDYQTWTGGTSLFQDYSSRDYQLAVATEAGTIMDNNVDIFGNIRGADGVWDRGAYEYGTVGVISIPGNLTITISSGTLSFE